MTRRTWIGLASTALGLASTALVLVVVLAYLNIATNVVSLPERLALMLAFAIGPVAIVGVLEICRELAPGSPGPMLRVGTVFLVIAFALLNLMLVVQQSIFIPYLETMRGTTDEALKDSMRLVFQGVNQVQLGIDVSFDIFYSLGLVLVSLVLIRTTRFGMVLGIYGAVVATGLLILNMATFPTPPAEAGLFDLGPYTGLWWLVLILGGRITGRRRGKRHQAQPDPAA